MAPATDTQAKGARTGRGALRALLLVVIAGVVLVLGFLTYSWFLNPPAQTVETIQPADAVVVFVGSDDRIETAIELVARGVASNLVVPNGENVARGLCDESSFRVFCSDTDTIDTEGEARAIGQLARAMGWTSLVAVTSEYHIHRATYQLALCHDGPIQAVPAAGDLARDDWVDSIIREWVGTLAAMTFQRAC